MTTADTKRVLTDVSNKLEEACDLLADGITRARDNYDRDGVITLAAKLIDTESLVGDIPGAESPLASTEGLADEELAKPPTFGELLGALAYGSELTLTEDGTEVVLFDGYITDHNEAKYYGKYRDWYVYKVYGLSKGKLTVSISRYY